MAIIKIGTFVKLRSGFYKDLYAVVIDIALMVDPLFNRTMVEVRVFQRDCKDTLTMFCYPEDIELPSDLPHSEHHHV